MNNAIGLDWIPFRDLSLQRKMPMMYYTENNHYFLFISDGLIAFETRIRIEATPTTNQINFESNFKDDIDNNKVPIGTKIIGEDGVTGTGVNTNKELFIRDTDNGGGLDIIIALTTTPKEGKVGGSPKINRKDIVMQAIDKNIVWGFSETTQNFKLFKDQLMIVPVGEKTEIWFKMTTGTGDVAFGELS